MIPHPNSGPSNNDPREQMKRDLSKWLQPFLTKLTAKPYRGQVPIRCTPLSYLIWTGTMLVLGLSLSAIAVHQPMWLGLLVIPGWILTTSGMRALQVVVMHHCSHINVTKNKSTDTLIGQCISALLVIQDFSSYTKSHRIHHSLKGHLTKRDDTLNFLFNELKLRPGMSKQDCWKRLRRSLWSPTFHARFLCNRLKGCFLSCPSMHREMAFLFWANVLRLIFATHTEVIFLLAWVLPVTIFYQICTSLRLVVEHEFPDLELLLNRDKRFVAESTKAVFLGEATPDPASRGVSKLLAWGCWWFRMLFIHGLCRILILQGDTPVHDVHTRCPGSDDWANALWIRGAELEEVCSRWTSPYQERWGLSNAIDGVFESISQLPPNFML